MIKLAKGLFFPFLIVLLTTFLAWQNFVPGTWLSGWDTLHPEFDFSLNISQVIGGVWRDEQGLGAVAAHAHMSDLPRILILYLFSLVFPLHVLRYLYIFLCLILGPLGMFFFLKHALRNQLASFLGSLFYLFNLAVLQHFYAPFEMFTTQYAALPWLFLAATRFIERKKPKDLFFFALVTLVATPMAYAPQLWYAYFVGFTIYAIFIAISSYPKKLSALQLPALLVITILAVNAFWLLPHLYFLTDAAKHVPLAQSNLLFSERAFLMNKFRGTIADVAILRGPLFDWLEFDGDQFVYLLSEWRTYFQDSFVLVIGYLLFCLTLVGFGISIIKKDRIGLAILPAFLLSFVFLLNMNPPLEIIFSLLREKITIFREALRFPYTKFSLLYLFGAAYYFAIGNKLILTKFKKTLYTQALYTITLSLFFVFYMLPVFFGFLIDPEIKIRFPESYFNLFRWFKQQPQGERIAVLPIHSMWGWEYYDFGYQGAGFIWFGLNQPVLVRDFDRWSSKNENFYWESMQITHRGDLPQLEKLLEKYQVGWLILDEKIINPYAPKTLNINNLENLLSKSSKISLVKNFENIKVYKIDLNSNPTESIFLTSNLPLVYPIYSWNNYDRAYNDLGTYQSTPNSQLPIPNFYYPFRSLFTGRRQEELEFSLDEDESYLKFVSLLPTNLTGSTLFIPPLKKEEISEIDEQNSAHELKKYPSLFLDGELLPTSFEGENKENIISLSYIKQGKLEVVQPKIRGYFSYDSNKEGNLFSLTEHTCDQFTRGKYSLDTLEENNQRFLRLSSSDSSICIDVTIPYLSNELGYLLTIEHRHISGQPLQFSLINTNSQMSILQTHLPQKGHKSYYIVPPSQEDATGYALHFENLSIGREPTVNDIARITIHPIPYDLLTKIRIVNTQTGNTEAAAMTDFPVVKALSSNAYLVTLAAGKPMIHQTLVLSQSFDAGWKAYEISNDQLSMINYQFLTQWFPFIFGKEIKEHVLINNWANGWDVTSLKCKSTKCEIVIIYLPQYLEYIGLVVTILTLGVVIYAWRPWGWITSSRLTRSSN